MRKILLFITALSLLFSLSACGGQIDAPEETSPSGEALTWQQQYDLGVRYLGEGNYREAIIAFTAAIAIDPREARAYIGLADAYTGAGDLESAKRALEDGLAATGNEEIKSRLDALSEPTETETEPEPEPEPPGIGDTALYKELIESAGYTDIVKVSTAEELQAAVGSDRAIILEPGVYNVDILSISSLSNLTILGSGDTGDTELMIDSGEDVVVHIVDSSDITLSNLRIGHNPDTAMTCFEGVVNVSGSSDIRVTNCDIYGCGLEGLSAYESSVTVDSTVIRDCSAFIANLTSSSVAFNNCAFTGNGYATYGYGAAFNLGAASLILTYCDFTGNQNELMVHHSEYHDPSTVSETGCTYSGNGWE